MTLALAIRARTTSTATLSIALRSMLFYPELHNQLHIRKRRLADHSIGAKIRVILVAEGNEEREQLDKLH
ncbi:hypothetical protein O9993_00915 [Vibrio lentus]|nr:hypothetical protein [Vibrio lentus]